MRILVGWDDSAQAELLKMYLSIDDNAVFITTDTNQFLTLAKSGQAWDIVLLTTSYPDHETAFSVFEQVRKAIPATPIVGACEQNDVYRLASYLTAGLRAYLIRDDNGDFLFLAQAILAGAVKQVHTERERIVSEQLRKEVESVRELQESMIPDDIETPDGFDIVGRYESSQIRVLGSQPVIMAGGDYYEAFTLPDNNIVTLIGDASGHGMKACMSIFTMHTLIRMIRFDDYYDAAKLVHHINSQLCRQSVVSNEGGFITMLYGVLNTETREYRWASAGHNTPLIHNLATDEITEISDSPDCSGLPIGIFEEAEYTTQSAVLPPNSRLLVYTDGLVEAFPGGVRESHTEFGLDGVRNSLKETRTKSLMECLDGLFRDSYAFTKGAGRHDDTSVLLLEID